MRGSRGGPWGGILFEIFKILNLKIERREVVEYAAAMIFDPHVWG